MKKFMMMTMMGALLLSFMMSAQAQTKPVTIGTLPQGSLGYAIASALASVMTLQGNIQTRVVGQGGSSVYIPQINQGEIEFGTSNTFEAIFATQGTGNFKGRSNPNIRVAALLVPFAVGLMVQRDSDIRQITDLRGKRFPVGYTRQRLVSIMQQSIFNAVGMSESDIEGIPVPNFVAGANMLAQGRVSGVLLAPGSGIVRRTHAKKPVRFLSIPNRPEVEQAIQKALPGTRLVLVKPNKRLPSIAGPVFLVGYQYALLTHNGVSEKVVYNVVKTLYENQAALAKAHGIFRRFKPKRMPAKLDGAIFHPGAVRFYREKGIWPGQ